MGKNTFEKERKNRSLSGFFFDLHSTGKLNS